MDEKIRVKRRFKRKMRAYFERVIVISIGVMLMAMAIHLLTKNTESEDVDSKANNTQGGQPVDIWETESYQKLPKANKSVTIMVDPGHGGNDPGTSSADGTVYEKDITWDVALMVQEYLKEADVTAVLSRGEDEFINKHDRATKANEQEVDLFVSIHCNFLENDTKTSGVETYYVDGVEDGQALANAVHGQVLAITGADDMYVRTNDFVVIKDTNMPAVLIEIGYLSSPFDVRLLETEKYKSKMAYGIAAGIIEYINFEATNN